MLRLPPQHKAHATSCSHSNAICYHSFKKRIELRTQEQPLVAKHIGGTIRDRNDRSRNRRTDEVPFIAGCSHFTRKNTRFRAPASSPTQSPCNIHAAIPMRSATCNVQSHTTLHQGQSFCDVLLCNAKSHTTLHQGQSFCYVLLCNVMSHTTLHQGQFFSDVLLCHVKSHTTLHQGQSLNRAPPFIISNLRILFVRNTEVLLPNFL